MWLSQLGQTIQPSDVLFNLTKFSITISEGIVNPNSSLIECNTYGLESSKNIKNVLKLINEKNNQHSDKLLIIEHVQDYETMKRFVMNVFTVVEDNLIKQEIKDFIK